jgi:hypothetical protein
MTRLAAILVVALAAASLSGKAASAAPEFSKAAITDENVLRLVRLLEAAGFSRIDFKGAETADGGRTVRLTDARAMGLENFELTSPTITASGLLRSGSRIAADAVAFKEPSFRRYDGAGVEVKSDTMSFASPETVVDGAAVPRIRFSRFSVDGAKFSADGRTIANVKTASLEAADWMPSGEMARSLKGRLIGSVASSFLGSFLPFDTSGIVSGSIPVDVAGVSQTGAGDSFASTVVVTTGGLGKYEFRVSAAGVPAETFSAIREVEEVTRSVGSTKPFSLLTRLTRAEDAVRIGSVSVQATDMAWVGTVLDRRAKASRTSRAELERELSTAFGGVAGVVSSNDAAERSKREFAKFLASPKSITFSLVPPQPSPLQKRWFLDLVSMKLGNFGFAAIAE